MELIYDRGVPEGAAERIQSLLLGESVVIQKRTKRKAMADIDIRPMLHGLELSEEPGILRLDATVSAQNPGLNPALLAAAIARSSCPNTSRILSGCGGWTPWTRRERRSDKILR